MTLKNCRQGVTLHLNSAVGLLSWSICTDDSSCIQESPTSGPKVTLIRLDPRRKRQPALLVFASHELAAAISVNAI
jgi:hypothetical protein